MNGSGSGMGSGGVDDRLGEKPLTMTTVLKDFQDLKDKFKNDDEEDCEFHRVRFLLRLLRSLGRTMRPASKRRC